MRLRCASSSGCHRRVPAWSRRQHRQIPGSGGSGWYRQICCGWSDNSTYGSIRPCPPSSRNRKNRSWHAPSASCFFIYKQYTKFTRKLQERQRDYFATYFHFRERGCGIYVFFTQTASIPIDGDLVFQADRCRIVPDGAWKICASVTGSISKFPIRFSAWARGKSKFLTYPAKARAISAAYGTRHRKAPISGCFAPESHRFTRIRTSMENIAWEIRQRERKIYEYRCFFGEIMLQYV